MRLGLMALVLPIETDVDAGRRNLDLDVIGSPLLQFFRDFAFVIPIRRLAVDDMQPQRPWVEPHSWHTVAVLAAVVSSCREVNDVAPCFVDLPSRLQRERDGVVQRQVDHCVYGTFSDWFHCRGQELKGTLGGAGDRPRDAAQRRRRIAGRRWGRNIVPRGWSRGWSRAAALHTGREMNARVVVKSGSGIVVAGCMVRAAQLWGLVLQLHVGHRRLSGWVPVIADVHVSRVEGFDRTTRLGAHYPPIKSHFHVLLPDLNIYPCRDTGRRIVWIQAERQWFLRAAVIVAAVPVPMDDMQPGVSWVEPHARNAITVVAAILAGRRDVKDVAPLFYSSSWRDIE